MTVEKINGVWECTIQVCGDTFFAINEYKSIAMKRALEMIYAKGNRCRS